MTTVEHDLDEIRQTSEAQNSGLRWGMVVGMVIAIAILASIALSWNDAVETSRREGEAAGYSRGITERQPAIFEHGMRVGKFYDLPRPSTPAVVAIAPEVITTSSGTTAYKCAAASSSYLMLADNNVDIGGTWVSTKLVESTRKFRVAWSGTDGLYLDVRYTDKQGKTQQRYIPILADDSQVSPESRQLAERLVTKKTVHQSLHETMLSMVHAVDIDLQRQLPDWSGSTEWPAHLVITTHVCSYHQPVTSNLYDPSSPASLAFLQWSK